MAGSGCGDVSGKCKNCKIPGMRTLGEQSARSLEDFSQLMGGSGGFRDRGGECCLR